MTPGQNGFFPEASAPDLMPDILEALETVDNENYDVPTSYTNPQWFPRKYKLNKNMSHLYRGDSLNSNRISVCIAPPKKCKNFPFEN